MGEPINRDNARELGRLGGLKSAEVRRAKRDMKESLNILLGMPLKKGKPADIEAIRNFAALNGKNVSVEQALLIRQIQKALKGDTGALQFIRDTSGQGIANRVDIAGALPVVFSGEDKLVDDDGESDNED
ncbi:MAG: hypothetical protein ACI4NM_01905 [Bullifex sp.]